jgi:hypothetical protein
MKRLFISCSAMALAVALGVHTSAQESEKPAVAVAQPTEAAKAPSADAKTPKATVAQATKSVRALSVTVEIVGGTSIQGTLVDSSELPMRTSFGQATIPLAEVAGIKLASQDNATTTVTQSQVPRICQVWLWKRRGEKLISLAAAFPQFCLRKD